MSTAFTATATATAIPTLLSHLTLSISTKNLHLGRAVHSLLLKTALSHHTLLSNLLIDLYSRCSSPSSSLLAFLDLPHKNPYSYNTLLAGLSRSLKHLPSALDLFDQMPQRNLVSYNTLISSLTHLGEHRLSLQIFSCLLKDRTLGDAIVIDRFTVVGVATACANLGALEPLRQAHGALVVSGLEMNVIMGNAMIDAYGKSGDADNAQKVFARMVVRDAVSWTSLLAAYCWARRVEDAVLVFDQIPARDSISWTALISGHEQNGKEEAALDLFEKMMEEKVAPTPFTLVSVLGACAKLGLVERGRQMHCFILRGCIGLDPFNLFTHNALIDMYAKCGDMASAVAVFRRMHERDFVSWNSMVTGFAQNGHGKQSIATFEKMLKAGVTPTNVTFLAVLTACSHAGLVSEGRRILDSMEKYGVQPRPEHYAALIDALGRNHQLEEAMEFIECLPSTLRESATIGTWGALLGACRVHGNLEFAERAAESLFQLEPENGARYVMLSNIYAAAGHWDNARRIRVLMKRKGLRKDQACSWIEVRSVKHIFVAADKSHCEIEEIYGMLATVFYQMKEIRDSVEEKKLLTL